MRLACVLGLALLSSSSRALADEPRVDPPPKRGWYGGQTLIVEGVSVVAVVAGIAIDSPLNRTRCEGLDSMGNCIERTPTTASSIADVLFYGGAGGYMLGPAFVHILHDRGGMAGASLGIRFVPPILLSIGSFMCFERLCGYMIPGMASVVGVAALDAGVFAYENVPRENVPRGAPMVSVAPWIDARGRASGFSLGGTF
jgi:hypothetical protein